PAAASSHAPAGQPGPASSSERTPAGATPPTPSPPRARLPEPRPYPAASSLAPIGDAHSIAASSRLADTALPRHCRLLTTAGEPGSPSASAFSTATAAPSDTNDASPPHAPSPPLQSRSTPTLVPATNPLHFPQSPHHFIPPTSLCRLRISFLILLSLPALHLHLHSLLSPLQPLPDPLLDYGSAAPTSHVVSVETTVAAADHNHHAARSPPPLAAVPNLINVGCHIQTGEILITVA
uniref:Uncharacterized protein n=1 Tax=Oryza punctata TaxID=4537 RepID=A0A0E0LAS5_ORYPU